MLVRQASVFLTDDEEFVLQLSRLHWKTFKENVWKRKKKKVIQPAASALPARVCVRQHSEEYKHLHPMESD